MARYNVAPTQAVIACRVPEWGGRELVTLRFGLVPHWSKGPDSRFSMINARAETVHLKPAYRDAFRHRRCLIPSDGFYEWKRTNGKQPYYIHRADGQPMAFAGVWDRWQGPNGETTASVAIITTTANETMAPIHDRMPVILAPEDFDAWLEPTQHDPAELLSLLQPCPDGDLEAWPVSTRINSPRNEGPELIAPL